MNAPAPLPLRSPLPPGSAPTRKTGLRRSRKGLTTRCAIRRRTPLSNRPTPKRRKREAEWLRMKARAIAERGDACEVCKVFPDRRCSGRADDAHHKAGKWRQSMDMLLLVGRFHHEWLPQNRGVAMAYGWIVRRNGVAA